MKTRIGGEVCVSEIGLRTQDLAGFQNLRGLLEAALDSGITYFHAADADSTDVLVRELVGQRDKVIVGASSAHDADVLWLAPSSADETELERMAREAAVLQNAAQIKTFGFTLTHLSADEQLTAGRWAVSSCVPLLALPYGLHEPRVGRELFALAENTATRFVVVLPKETTTLDTWLGADLAEIVSVFARQSRQLRFLTDSGRTLAQTAIKFALAQPSVVCVLPYIGTLADLQSAIAATDAPDLTRGELNRIDDLVAHGFHLQPFEPTSVYNG